MKHCCGTHTQWHTLCTVAPKPHLCAQIYGQLHLLFSYFHPYISSFSISTLPAPFFTTLAPLCTLCSASIFYMLFGMQIVCVVGMTPASVCCPSVPLFFWLRLQLRLRASASVSAPSLPPARFQFNAQIHKLAKGTGCGRERGARGGTGKDFS